MDRNPDGIFYQYSVSISSDNKRVVESKGIGRKIVDKRYQTYSSELSRKRFSYDGEKSLYTLGPLPQNNHELTVVLEESFSKRSGNLSHGSSNEPSKRSKWSFQSKTFKVKLSYAAKIPLRSTALALQGAVTENVRDSLRVLDIILRQQAANKSEIECSVLTIIDKFAARGLRSLAVTYQRDNVRNQREYLILLLANVHIRLDPKPEPLNKRLSGKKFIFITGTDEHGEKIATAAAANGTRPPLHCDSISGAYKALWENLDIAYDKFIRTIDSKHEAIVKEFYSRVLASGDVYRADYEGLYCVNCEEYKDYTQQRPSQELVAKDLHGNEWKFRHISRGQPRTHLLTTGWSALVKKKFLCPNLDLLFVLRILQC